MARLRTLKPGFFTNEVLIEIEPLGRLLFQGLWCLADREGRLEDRPGRIKLQVLPGDECNVDGLLGDLAAHGFIVRYEAGGARYIQVVNFKKHQTPHMKEQASTIPAPDMHGASTEPAPEEHETSTPGIWELGTWNTVVGTGEGDQASPPREEVMPAASDALPVDHPDEMTAAEPEPVPAKPPRYSPSFEAIWLAYPTSGGMSKAKAYAAYKALKPDGEMADAILTGIANWKRGQRWQEGYVMSLERWLKERNWESTVDPWSPPTQGPPRGKNPPVAPKEAGIVAWQRRRESQRSGNSALGVGLH